MTNCQLKCLLGWTIRTVMIFAVFAEASGDSWENKVAESREELRDKNRQQWVGAFSCLIGTDQRIYSYTSAKKNYMAIRLIGVFGVQESIFVNVREREGVLYLDGTERLINYEPLSTTLVSAKYGPRIYLVPYGRIHGFCLNVLEAKKLDDYLHDSAELDPTNNELVLDPKFEIFKKLPPLKIVLSDTNRVNTGRESRIIFENKESYSLYPGMYLSCQDDCLYEIKRVEGDRAEAVLNLNSVLDPLKVPVPNVLVTRR